MKYENKSKEEIGYEEMIEEGEIIAFIYCTNQEDYLDLMTPHFDGSPNTTLLRLLGFAVYHYEKFDGSPKESFDNMMAEMLKNPLLQNLLMIQSSNVINEAAGG